MKAVWKRELHMDETIHTSLRPNYNNLYKWFRKTIKILDRDKNKNISSSEAKCDTNKQKRNEVKNYKEASFMTTSQWQGWKNMEEFVAHL